MTPGRDAVLRRFPLVPRPRPPCLPLVERVQHQLTDPARLARDEPDPAKSITLAASVQNQAALLASDLGLTDLARQLCWHQFDTFRAGWPLHAAAARHSLEPLANLARLYIRTGEPDRGLATIESLHRTAPFAGDMVIDDRQISFADLLVDGDACQDLRRWLWTILLADGTRALTSQGRWQEAAEHAERHQGIGRRLLDGRQALVLAHHTTGDLASAHTALRDTRPIEPWEHLIHACLATICTPEDPQPTQAAADHLSAMLAKLTRPVSGQHHLSVRADLVVLDLIGPGRHTKIARIARRTIDDTIRSRDGLLARQTLNTHQLRTRMTAGEAQILTQAEQASGLGDTHLRDDARPAIDEALTSSTEVINQRFGQRGVPASRAE